MRTIGQILKEARIAKKYTVVRLENATRIKKDFIEAIEEERWQDLPPFATVAGFVKNLASELGIEEKSISAILRRDYPPKKTNINPKPDVIKGFNWSPKITFFVGIGAVFLAIFGYVAFQYFRFSAPPKLLVESPQEGQSVSGSTLVVFGSTDVDSVVTVNNQPVLTDSDGNFSVSLEISGNTNEIVIKSVSRSGKETSVRRTIKVE